MRKNRISIIGTGYVGLCTAVGFAYKGFSVIASDNDVQKVKMVNSGIPPFHEPDLQNLLILSLKNESFKCLPNQTEKAVLDSDLTFVTVGTPSKPDGDIDLTFLESSVHDIGQALRKKDDYHLVVIKSTVTPQTTNKIVKIILENESRKKSGIDFGLCMNPEFLRQGSAFSDTMHPDRIIIGADDQKSGDTLETFYKSFHSEKVPPIIRTSTSTAELCKYASNSFLATKISFINMIANICQKIPGADVTTVAKVMGLDKRISPNFLNAGIGYGGSCFPKDVKALKIYSQKLGYCIDLLESVDSLNSTQPLKVIELCKTKLGNLKGKKIAILGLAFKPETDDMRQAPSIPIISHLLESGAEITAYDPKATLNAKLIFENKIQYANSSVACLKNKDCCIIVTEWQEFKNLKSKDFTKNMKNPIIIDGRRIYNPQKFKQQTTFLAIGLG